MHSDANRKPGTRLDTMTTNGSNPSMLPLGMQVKPGVAGLVEKVTGSAIGFRNRQNIASFIILPF
jgi:hypothetical protein